MPVTDTEGGDMIDKIIQAGLYLRVPVLILMFAVIGFGVYSYIETPRDAFPDISPVMVPPVLSRRPSVLTT